jgi:hypothetical protein
MDSLDLLVQTDFEELLERSFDDQHTQPQFWNFLPYPDIKLFRFENLDAVWRWLSIDNPHVHERNHLTREGMYPAIYNLVAEKAQRDKIEVLYSEDMKLWNCAL